jgi:hypothetical protein
MRITKSQPRALRCPQLFCGDRIVLPLGQQSLIGAVQVGIGVLEIGIRSGVHLDLGVRLIETGFRLGGVLCDRGQS